MKVWIVTVIELDSECYAASLASYHAVNATREGALISLAQILEQHIHYDDYESSEEVIAEVLASGFVEFEYGSSYVYEASITAKEIGA